MRKPTRTQLQPVMSFFALLLSSCLVPTAHAFLDGIPLEQLFGQMGGGGGQQIIINGQPMGGAPRPQFPPGVSNKIEEKYSWMINTEWKSGAGTVYTFQRGGELVSTATGETQEGSCKWAANQDTVFLVTPTTMKKAEKVVRFRFVGDSDLLNPNASQEVKNGVQQQLDNHNADELAKMKLESLTANKKGKRSVLDFSRVATSAEEDSTLAADPYEILAVDKNTDTGAIKKAYRKLSISHHPDRGGDAHMFDQIRMAYEILSDPELRRYYDLGGALLTKNMETGFKEVESQVAQQLAQLDQQVPKGHPAREQYENQIKAQGENKQQIRAQLEKKMTNDNEEISVRIPMEKLFRGGPIGVEYSRRLLVPGCRGNPQSEKCLKAGRCPPEVKQVPKMQGPFMVGTKQVEVESREKCVEEVVKLNNVNVPPCADNGTLLHRERQGGSQTPGKMPGDVIFKVQQMPHDEYFLLGHDLYTVLRITHEEALFGFNKQFYVLGDKSAPVVSIDRTGKTSQPGEVIKKAGQGMFFSGHVRGDLFIRLKVEFPSEVPTEPVTKPTEEDNTADLTREHETVNINERQGKLYREWGEMYEKKKKNKGKKNKNGKKKKKNGESDSEL